MYDTSVGWNLVVDSLKSLDQLVQAGEPRCHLIEEMADAMQKAKAAKGPVVIACEIDREDMVYPMVPSNQSIDEMILQGGR